MLNFRRFKPETEDFTSVLERLSLPPKILYRRGDLPRGQGSERPKTVAIIGSRHNTRYGAEVAHHLSYELARHGVIVVSGLAYGIDSIGHQGCIDGGGITIAVLGNPIDCVHPVAHTKLAEEILRSGGAILSEYPPANDPDAPLAPGESFNSGTRCVSYKTSFLYRNRLIAGLSDAVVVVEAAIKSGSLNTATHALEQGKDVFAVPGNVNSPYSQGCNKLILQGALPYTEPDDVLRVIMPEQFAKKSHTHRKLVGDSEVETAILQSLGSGLSSGSEITVAAKLPPELFNQYITLLEIKGRVHSLGANHWSLA